MTSEQIAAINLLLEDLHTVHSHIRCQAKELNCEKELDEYKREVLFYLLNKVSNNTKTVDYIA